MMDEGDDGARVGVWVTAGVITLVLLGLIGGLAIRQSHKGADKTMLAQSGATAAAMAPAATADVVLDGPPRGELLTQIFFESGSAELPAAAAEAVAVAGVALGQAPASAKLLLSGFHDASGDPAKNADLAKQRTKALRAAFVAAGLEDTRVLMRKPESTQANGKAEEARRVEVHLVN